LSAKGEGSMGVPGRDECLQMLRDQGCDEAVIRHCIAVTDLAVRIAKKCRADVRLTEAGALLHDIGRGQSHGMDHAVVGARLARELGLPDTVVGIIERHIGGGLTGAEARRLGLPRKSYLPRTLEEKIVAHADNLMSGDRRTSLSESVGHLIRKRELEAARRVLELHKELSAACGINVDDVV